MDWSLRFDFKRTNNNFFWSKKSDVLMMKFRNFCMAEVRLLFLWILLWTMNINAEYFWKCSGKPLSSAIFCSIDNSHCTSIPLFFFITEWTLLRKFNSHFLNDDSDSGRNVSWMISIFSKSAIILNSLQRYSHLSDTWWYINKFMKLKISQSKKFDISIQFLWWKGIKVRSIAILMIQGN